MDILTVVVDILTAKGRTFYFLKLLILILYVNIFRCFTLQFGTDKGNWYSKNKPPPIDKTFHN